MSFVLTILRVSPSSVASCSARLQAKKAAAAKEKAEYEQKIAEMRVYVYTVQTFESNSISY